MRASRRMEGEGDNGHFVSMSSIIHILPSKQDSELNVAIQQLGQCKPSFLQQPHYTTTPLTSRLHTTFTWYSLLKKTGGAGCGQMEKGGQVGIGEVIPREDTSKAMKPWSYVVQSGDEARMKAARWAKTIYGGDPAWRSGLMMAGVHFVMGRRPVPPRC